MKKVTCWVLALLLFTGLTFAKKVAVLSEISKPFKFRVDDNNFYISEGVHVFVYSLKDYKLATKFGNEGEGPGEILLDRREGNTQVALHIEPDQVVVRATTKLIYYSKNGKYLKEMKTGSAGKWLCPFAEGFVGKKYTNNKDGDMFHNVYYYDKNLKQVGEIYNQINGWQGPTKPFNPLLTRGTKFEVDEGKLFVMDSFRKYVRAYDKDGKKLMEISHNNKPVPFTEKDKQKMVNDYRQNKIWKMMYETRRHLFKFPDHFPPIYDFEIDSGQKKIYMASEMIENDQRKWFVFDMKGKQLKELLFPPEGKFQFHNDKGYRLYENEDGDWELHFYDSLK